MHRRVSRSSGVVFRCQVDEDEKVDRHDIPGWMFDAVVCSQQRLSKDPHVGLNALAELTCLLDGAARQQRMHDRPPVELGGPDDDPNPTTKVAHAASTESLRTTTSGAEMERPDPEPSRGGDEVIRADVAGALGPTGRVPSGGYR